MTVEFIGPFAVRKDPYRFSVDGYEVPNLVGYKTGENEWELGLIREGKETFFYEGFSSHAVQLAVPVIAQAMALAAGWSSFGPHGTKDNDFKTKVNIIGQPEEE